MTPTPTPRPTPETDNLILSCGGWGPTNHEWREHARDLERERDEAREWQNVKVTKNGETHCLGTLIDLLERERDEARDQLNARQLWADELQMENMKLKLEIAAVKSKLTEVVSIARQGRYSAMDFVAVGKRLDAMDDYLANDEMRDGEHKTIA